MRKSQIGTKSKFGQSGKSKRTLVPWGKPIPKMFPRSRKPTGRGKVGKADSSLRSMSYPKNDPAMWPLESPATRADLRLESAMTQAKADANNAAVNKAFQRGGYAG